MGLEMTGQAIAELRRKAGLTQRELAEKLGISDKAVSKWERGLSYPDISCLEQLTELLDTEMDSLLAGARTRIGEDWRGLLLLAETEPQIKTVIYDKPLVDYLLSNFLLAGIREITVPCGAWDRDFLEERFGDGGALGLTLRYPEPSAIPLEGNTMFMFGNWLLYGAGLTRRYQKAMTEKNKATLLSRFLFLPKKVGKKLQPTRFTNQETLLETLRGNGLLLESALGRGIIALPLATWDDILDAANFVRVVQRHSGERLCDLTEIARRRDLLREKAST